MRSFLWCSVVFCLMIGTCLAQETDEENLTFSGFVDMYYQYNLNNPEMNGNLGTTGVGRVFDSQHDHIALNMLQLKTTYTQKDFEFCGDLLFGPGAELAQFGNTGTSVSIKQAYVSWKPNARMAFTFGQYSTHIGFEVVDAFDNFNYSLSYLFGNGPFYHVGAKFDYQISKSWSAMIGLLNGWDHIIDNNRAKTLAAQLAFKPNDDFSLLLNYIGGDEDPSSLTGDSLSDFKQMFDLTGSYRIVEECLFGVNAIYGLYHLGNVPNQIWWGAAAYLHYDFSSSLSIGARYEYFDDHNQIQYFGARYNGITLTGVYKTANGHLFIKPELRMDFSDKSVYQKGVHPTTSQQTIGLALIGKF